MKEKIMEVVNGIFRVIQFYPAVKNNKILCNYGMTIFLDNFGNNKILILFVLDFRKGTLELLFSCNE